MEADWGKANLKAREKGLVRKEMDLPKRMERVKLKGKAGKNKLQGRKDFRTSSALQARTLHRTVVCRTRTARRRHTLRFEQHMFRLEDTNRPGTRRFHTALRKCTRRNRRNDRRRISIRKKFPTDPREGKCQQTSSSGMKRVI